MIRGEQIKLYLWYLVGVMGVVFFWAGVWDGLGSLPYLSNPWISLLVGLAMFTLSGVLFKDVAPFWGTKKTVHSILHHVRTHAQPHQFHIQYHDKLTKKDVFLRGDKLHKIEKDFMIILDEGKKEIFVPVHRIRAVLHKGKHYWKA